MHLLLVGMNHRTAVSTSAKRWPSRVRNAWSRTSGWPPSGCAEALIVATCNRTEFYVVHHDEVLADACVRDVRATPARRRPARPRGLALRRRRHRGCAPPVPRGLWPGLDGIGRCPDPRADQGRRGAGARSGTVGPLLDRLFDRALSAGKRARAETSVSGGIVSVASAAVELLRTELTSLAGRRVLVVGAGETARLVARQLGQARPSRLLIANRTLEAAADSRPRWAVMRWPCPTSPRRWQAWTPSSAPRVRRGSWCRRPMSPSAMAQRRTGVWC